MSSSFENGRKRAELLEEISSLMLRNRRPASMTAIICSVQVLTERLALISIGARRRGVCGTNDSVVFVLSEILAAFVVSPAVLVLVD
jgi:hypothetical protein